MSFHSTDITNMPIDIVIFIFNKIVNINDVIKFAYCNKYVFDIYKNNINLVIQQLINNSNVLVNYIIQLCYDKNDTIENKLKNIKLIDNFLSNNTYDNLVKDFHSARDHYNNPHKIDEKIRLFKYYHLRVFEGFNHDFSTFAMSLLDTQLNVLLYLVNFGYNFNNCYKAACKLNMEQVKLMISIVQRGINFNEAIDVASKISEDKIGYFFELKNRNFSVENSIVVITQFDNTKIEIMNQLIQKGIAPESSVEAVDSMSQNELELFIKIASINNNAEFLYETISRDFDENELKIVIKLLENNFDINEINCIITAMNSNHESCSEKCIELKNKGVSERSLWFIIEDGMLDDFDIELYNFLTNRIDDSDTIIQIILTQKTHKEIKRIIKLINQNITPEIAFKIVDIDISQQSLKLIKPYLKYICPDFITRFVNNFNEINNYIKMYKEIKLHIKYIMQLLLASNYWSNTINIQFSSDIIRIIKEMRTYNIKDDAIIKFIIGYSNKFNKIYENINIYQLHQINQCISFINKGIDNLECIFYVVKMGQKYVSYIENLDETDFNIIKQFDYSKFSMFINLCGELNDIKKNLKLVHVLSKEGLTKINNIALTGKTYRFSIELIINQYN
jgi:hypothetical protein